MVFRWIVYSTCYKTETFIKVYFCRIRKSHPPNKYSSQQEYIRNPGIAWTWSSAILCIWTIILWWPALPRGWRPCPGSSMQSWKSFLTWFVQYYGYEQWSNLTLMWAHLPVPYTVIGVTGKWLVTACKCTIIQYTFWDMNYFLIWMLVKSRTDGQTDGQKVMHMSPPCISTGLLNKIAWFVAQYSLLSVHFWKSSKATLYPLLDAYKQQSL